MTTSPISARNAFDQQSEILHSCLAAIESKQATVDSYVGKFPEFPELDELLQSSTFIRQSPPVSLTGKSRAQIQSRVLTSYRQRIAVKHSLTVVRPQRNRWMMLMRPLVALLVVAVLLYSGGSSLLYAASQSIPGESLYGVKRTGEQVQLSFASGEARVSLLDWLANIRLDEVTLLVQRGITLTEPIMNDVSSFVQQALAVQTDLIKRNSLTQRTIQTLSAARQAGMLSSLLENKTMSLINAALTAANSAHGNNGSDNSDNSGKSSAPGQANKTGTQAALTATPTPTPSIKPTKIRKTKPPKSNNGNGNSNPPKGGKP